MFGKVKTKIRNNFKGYIGELKFKIAVFFLLGRSYKLLNNVTILMPDKNTTQIDHIIVSRYGIFVIETKNYRGEITVNERTGQWAQSFYQTSYQFYSPIRQNNGHIGALRYLLKSKQYPLINIVFFAGEATFKNNTLPSGVAIGAMSVIKLIKSYKKKEIGRGGVAEIARTIESRRLPNTRRTTRRHIKNMKKNNSR